MCLCVCVYIYIYVYMYIHIFNVSSFIHIFMLALVCRYASRQRCARAPRGGRSWVVSAPSFSQVKPRNPTAGPRTLRIPKPET